MQQQQVVFEANGRMWITDPETLERLRNCRDNESWRALNYRFAVALGTGKIKRLEQ